MSTKRHVFLLLAALAPVACGDAGFTGPGNDEIAGEYVASAERGQFTFATEAEKWDLTREGSIVQLQIFTNGTTAGRIFIPAEDESAETYEASLAGRWFMEGQTIYFAMNEPNLVGNMEFRRAGNQLHAERQFVDGMVTLTLVK